MYTNVFLSRLPLFFSLSLSPPPHCKSTSSLFALRRSILLLHPALRRFPLLFISPPLPPSSLSLSFSPRSFLTLCTRICTYTQCSLSLRHRDHSSSRFHPLGRLPFNPLLLPRDSTVSAPSLLHYTLPPRAFSSSLVAASFRLPTIQPLRALFPSAALPFPDTRHLHPSYLYASYHLRYTSVPPSSPSPRLSSRANGIQPPNSFPPPPPRFQPHLLGEKSRLPICRVIPCLGEIDEIETVNRRRGIKLSWLIVRCYRLRVDSGLN